MRLNDLKDWIQEVVSTRMPDIKFKVFVGKYVADSNDCEYHLISLRSGGGDIRPPFTEYKRVNILVLSPLYEGRGEQGDDYSGDLPAIGNQQNPVICEKPKLPDGDSVWTSAEELTKTIINEAEVNKQTGGICFSKGALQPISGARLSPSDIDGRIYFETTLQIII